MQSGVLVLVLALALLGLASALICPDGGMCEDRNTCCQNPSGGYGCCPLPNAECCEDHLHCCYEGTVCDLAHSKCVNKTVSLPWLSRGPAKQPASSQQPEEGVKAVICPDKESECPDDTTCCQLLDGTWGCCPMVRAVCCEDKMHCCPEATTCDLAHSKCQSSDGASVPMLQKLPARRRGAAGTGETVMAAKTPPARATALQNTVNSVACNDSVACADGTTCCKSLEGLWACCPLPKAVCCEDHLHCCPQDTVCNLPASSCDDPSGNALVPWLDKVPALPRAAATPQSKCDASSSCPGKSTCCKTASGGWACCPLTKAVCCDDHAHCCPHGTACNTEAGTCDDPAGAAPPSPWATKTPAKTPAQTPSKTPAAEQCDPQTACPSGTTCCKQSSGEWACCPLPHAVCCDDHEHCCPKGYACDVSQQSCDKPGALSLPWVPKTPALPRTAAPPPGSPAAPAAPRPPGNVCDAQTSCPKGTTCCLMNAPARWGCCPLPEAVCCSDGDHCCPSGFTCDPQRTSCSRGLRTVPWYRKQPALTHPLARLPLSRVVESGQSAEAAGAGDVPCDSAGEFSCAEQDTCCKTSATEWACCPSPKAVCCADGKHCCPMGYVCDLAAGGCAARGGRLTWDSFFTDTETNFVPFDL